jgi:hypothetical protein
MEQIISKAEELAGHVKEYVNNHIHAAKLSVAEKTSRAASTFIASLIIAALFIFFLFFSGIALALALSNWIHDPVYGYLLVAGIYLLLAILVFALKRKILQVPIMNSLLQQLFEDNKKNGKD